MLLNKRFEFNNKPHLKLKNEQIKSIKEFSDEVKNLKLNDYEKLSCLICNQDNFDGATSAHQMTRVETQMILHK